MKETAALHITVGEIMSSAPPRTAALCLATCWAVARFRVAQSPRRSQGGIDTARYLQPGDVVEFEVEGIGTLRNTLGLKVNLDPDYRYKAK